MEATSSLPVIAALAPISLAELQADAAWLTRWDRKYLVPVGHLEAVLNELDPATRALEIDGRRCFAYTTPYFDDDALTAYRAALHRRPQRFKVRTRLYVDSGVQLLEVKVRDRRGRTVKHRIDRDESTLEELTARDRDWLRGIPQVAPHVANLGHRLTTRYRRSTLVPPGGESRVTIDRELVFAMPDDRALTLEHLAIIETKGPGMPTALDRALWWHGYRPQALSKFAAGLCLLRPELPANRWHRVRQRLLAEVRVLR